ISCSAFRGCGSTTAPKNLRHTDGVRPPARGSDPALAVTMVMAISPRNALQFCTLARPLSTTLSLPRDIFSNATLYIAIDKPRSQSERSKRGKTARIQRRNWDCLCAAAMAQFLADRQGVDGRGYYRDFQSKLPPAM